MKGYGLIKYYIMLTNKEMYINTILERTIPKDMKT